MKQTGRQAPGQNGGKYSARHSGNKLASGGVGGVHLLLCLSFTLLLKGHCASMSEANGPEDGS